jgi:pyrroloquinoline quinone biosynthesis protein E
MNAGQLRMAARFAAHRLRELHPYEVQALLLNACDLKCSYCRYPEIRTRVLSTAQWQEVLRGLGRLGTLRVKFQGGEPTLRSDFLTLCATAREAGIRTAVVSNGQRIAEDPGLLAELDELVLSIDGPDAACHDAQRGAGTHARVLRALDAARERGLPVFAVMVVTRRNLDRIEEMLDWCEARGVGLHAQPVLFGLDFCDGGSRAELELDPEQVRAFNRRMAAWSRAGRRVMFWSGTYERTARWTDYGVPSVPSNGASSCMAGRFYVHIEANGDVHPCQPHGSALRPRNVRDGLVEALRHARQHDCGDCFHAYLNERKALFGLQPGAVWHALRRG